MSNNLFSVTGVGKVTKLDARFLLLTDDWRSECLARDRALGYQKSFISPIVRDTEKGIDDLDNHLDVDQTIENLPDSHFKMS